MTPLDIKEAKTIVKDLRYMQTYPTRIVGRNIEEYSQRAADFIEYLLKINSETKRDNP